MSLMGTRLDLIDPDRFYDRQNVQILKEVQSSLSAGISGSQTYDKPGITQTGTVTVVGGIVTGLT